MTESTIIGVLLTLALIFLCMGVAFFVSKKDGDLGRKIIHIGVSNFYFIFAAFFKETWPAVLGLLAFAGINFLMTKKGLFAKKSTEGAPSYGMVWYPLAAAAMLGLTTIGIGSKVAFGCGLLSLGYGDGLASLIGRRFGRKRIYGKKTWAGTIAMCLVTMTVCLLLTGNFVFALAAGVLAAAAEAFTPFDLDNVTVPFIVFFLAALMVK